MRRVVFPAWILRGLGDEELRVQPFEAPRAEGWDVLAPQFSIGYMDNRWLFECDARLVLLDVYETLFGPLDLEPWAYDELHLRIGPALRSAFMRQDLVVLAVRRRNASVPGEALELPPPSKPPKVDETTWFEIQVVDDIGTPIDKLDMTMTIDGTPRRITTDGAGVARVDQARAGYGSAEVASIQQLRDLLEPRWQKPRNANPPKGSNVTTRQLEEPIAPVTLENEVRAILVIMPRFRCREIPGSSFLFGRSFVQRSAFSALSAVARELQGDRGLRGMIFGHTDVSGPSALNKELSERRAKAVRALLTHDTSAWDELWQDTGGNAWHEKWGTREVQHMLNTLSVSPGDGKGPLREDGVADERTAAAIKAFQGGSAASGVVDDATRKDLFLAYAKRITPAPIEGDSQLSTAGNGKFMGCAEFNPLSLHAKDAESRRVVVLTYDIPAEPQGLPCKLGTITPCLGVTSPPKTEADPGGKPPYRCKVYQEAAACCPSVPGPELGHNLTIVLPFTLDFIKTLPHVLVLESQDGTVLLERPLSGAAEGEDKRPEVVFELLPEALLYRLHCKNVEKPYEIFPFTPWDDIPNLKIDPLPTPKGDHAVAAVLHRDDQNQTKVT